MGMRDGIVVEIEADVRSFVRVHALAFEDGIGVVGQGQQVRRLFGEDLANAFAGIFRAAPIGGDAAAPGVGLVIEIGKIDE